MKFIPQTNVLFLNVYAIAFVCYSAIPLIGVGILFTVIPNVVIFNFSHCCRKEYDSSNAFICPECHGGRSCCCSRSKCPASMFCLSELQCIMSDWVLPFCFQFFLPLMEKLHLSSVHLHELYLLAL